MMRTLFAAASAAALLAACSPAPSAENPDEATSDAASAPAGPTALGLTEAQLEGADIITPRGVDLGEVQRVDVDSSGVITGLIVEPKGEGGPRWVRIPLDGLTPVKEGADYDLEANMTLEQLKAMPAWAP